MYISWGAEKFRLWYSRVETFQTPVVCKLAESIFNREKVTKPILYFRTGSGEFVAPHSQRCVFQPYQHIGHAYKIAAFLNCSICGMLNLLWLRQWLIKIYICKLAWNIDSCTALNETQKLVTDPLRWLGFTVHRQRGNNLCGKLKLGVYVRRALNWKFIIRSGTVSNEVDSLSKSCFIIRKCMPPCTKEPVCIPGISELKLNYFHRFLKPHVIQTTLLKISCKMHFSPPIKSLRNSKKAQRFKYATNLTSSVLGVLVNKLSLRTETWESNSIYFSWPYYNFHIVSKLRGK